MRHGGNVWDEARPEDWLDYSANLRPEGTPEWVMETLRRAVADTRYYPDRHMRMAREGFAAALGVGADCILPTAGGAQAIDLALSLDEARCAVDIRATVSCDGRTGVEMEALTAASTAALTVYDMCKAVQKDMVITDVRLIEKTGGVHGDFHREEAEA